MTIDNASDASLSQSRDDKIGYRLLLDLAQPYRLALLGILLLMLAQSMAALVNPWLAGRFAAAMLQHDDVGHLLIAWFAVVLVQGMLAWAVSVRTQTTTATLVAEISTRVFDHLQSLPLAWHQGRPHGEVLSLLTQDVQRLGQFLVGAVTPLLPLLLTCIGALAMMFAIAPWFALAAAVLVPMIFLLMRLAGRRLRPLGQQVVAGMADKSAVAGQSLSMLPVIKAYAGETAESQRYGISTRAVRERQIALSRYSALITPGVRLLAAAVVFLLLWLASREVAAGTLQPDGLVSLLLYGLLLTQPVSALAGVYGQVQVARGTAQRLLDVLGESPEPDTGHYVPTTVRGEVRFEGVGFHHAGRVKVLQDLDLVLHAGETVAITGINGAGKSTLVHLLLRFVDPDHGRILLDGRDLRDYDLRHLRASIGLVSQNVLLFDAAVGANIAYGRVGATQEEIEAAARLAQAHDFIAALPQGYATGVGERGVKLSGGQQQRVALARALLKDPAVLILDEATAMFDPEAERDFIHDARALLRQRSIVLITHRPASLALADRVLRLQDGHLQPVKTPPRG